MRNLKLELRDAHKATLGLSSAAPTGLSEASISRQGPARLVLVGRQACACISTAGTHLHPGVPLGQALFFPGASLLSSSSFTTLSRQFYFCFYRDQSYSCLKESALYFFSSWKILP